MSNSFKTPSVGDFPALAAWLDQHRARHLWTALGNRNNPTVHGYRVGSGVAIVLLYPPHRSGERWGWGIATEPDTNDETKTLADAERRLQVKEKSS